MSEVEKLNEQIVKLQAERDSAMLRERDDVLAKIREQMKAYGFKTSDFKYVLMQKQIELRLV